MNKVATKPPSNELYESDFYLWTLEQARLLREQRWPDLDLENLAEEIESMGRSEKHQIKGRMRVLVAHLLKWKFQPGRRGDSWIGTIFEQRTALADLIEDSPSLREFLNDAVSKTYRAARLRASNETGIAYGLFPAECPFTPEEVLDLEFFPEDRALE